MFFCIYLFQWKFACLMESSENRVGMVSSEFADALFSHNDDIFFMCVFPPQQ